MLADLLIGEGRCVGVVVILPALDESIKSQINAYECFSELTEIPGTSACFIMDNSTGDRMELNAVFADSFLTFLDIPLKHRSIRGNIDKAEIMETLKAHGSAVIVRSSGKESADVIRAAGESVFAPLEPDRAVKYITASFSGDVCMEDLEKAFGTPVDNFRTFNEEETVCCMSGLAYPQTRLETIYGRIAENKELVKKNLAAARETGLKKGVNFLEGMEMESGKAEVKKPQSKRDIMSRYL